MLFNSFEFLLFFPIVIILYFLTPGKWRWVPTLIASYFFYGWWKAEYLILIVFSTIIDYFCALKIEKTTTPKRKRILLFISLGVNLGLLAFFKYYNFFTENINELFNHFNVTRLELPYSDFLLPVGISFYTFQTLSYTLDVYNKKLPAERHFGRFAVFVSFWPQLVAGPIERASSLLPQLKQKHKFSYDRTVWGLTQIAYGFFKKICVADRLSIYVNEVYNNPATYETSTPFIIATFFFAIQIYCDFSAYSDIAIGSARIMGVDLMTNFNRPYLSTKFSEFWRKWHISLSTWFRDYVYIPLGGSKKSPLRTSLNLFITFLISGLWHGASWNFILWGALHGALLIGERLITKKIKLPNLSSKIIGFLITFTVINFTWIFFRANTLADTLTIINQIGQVNFTFNLQEICAQKGPLNILFSFLAIGILALSYLLPKELKFSSNKAIAFCTLCLFLIILIGKNGEEQFIYFQF